jgi:hypothetical protein
MGVQGVNAGRSALRGYSGVDLGGLEACVAQELLCRAQVHAGFL